MSYACMVWSYVLTNPIRQIRDICCRGRTAWKGILPTAFSCYSEDVSSGGEPEDTPVRKPCNYSVQDVLCCQSDSDCGFALYITKHKSLTVRGKLQRRGGGGADLQLLHIDHWWSGALDRRARSIDFYKDFSRHSLTIHPWFTISLTRAHSR